MVVIVIECPCYNKVEDKDEKMCGRVNYEDDDENDEGSNDKNKELELFGTSFSHGPAKAQAQILKLKTPHILCIHDENCLTPFLHQQNLLRLHATHMGVAV